MDYEKKYKELVGKIEKAYLYVQTDSTKSVLEEILPELCMSEDERIRKELIDFVKSRLAGFPKCDRFISWLEKQGEQNPTAWSEEDERERKRIIELIEGWLSTFKETCYAEDCKCGIVWLKSLKERIGG